MRVFLCGIAVRIISPSGRLISPFGRYAPSGPENPHVCDRACVTWALGFAAECLVMQPSRMILEMSADVCGSCAPRHSDSGFRAADVSKET